MKKKNAHHIPQTETEAIALGLKRVSHESFGLGEQALVGQAQGIFRKDCQTLNTGDLCLQTNPREDGTVTVCYCNGVSCSNCYDTKAN